MTTHSLNPFLKIENNTIVGAALLPDGTEFKINAKRKNN